MNDDILKELGTKLQKLRIQKGLSQTEVSKATGISVYTISKMENGNNISSLYLIKLLKKYEVMEDFNNIISVPEFSPLALSKLKKKQRKRIRH